MNFVVHHGDCLAVMRTMPDSSVDSIVTDPPYGLSFMGKRWDYDVPAVEVWAECLRVLKPGGHMLAFAGTRTQHRMAVRIEDAGFEIRDMIAWVYGSGFPKSHNGEWGGTALKPALEPITMARKPLDGTVEKNWREHGTGALNIDGCRVAADAGDEPFKWSSPRGGIWKTDTQAQAQALGRWPANLIHDGSDEVLAAFPRAPGQQGRARTDGAEQGNNTFGALRHVTNLPDPRGDSGSAARFFYCAKASKRDRNEGCEHIEAKPYSHDGRETPIENAYQRNASNASNSHPTVKPTDLMRYLCRLVTPPCGVVLDPFTGSGSTGKAAVIEGFKFIGIERESEYAEIARTRILFAVPGNDIPQGDLFGVDA